MKRVLMTSLTALFLFSPSVFVVNSVAQNIDLSELMELAVQSNAVDEDCLTCPDIDRTFWNWTSGSTRFPGMCSNIEGEAVCRCEKGTGKRKEVLYFTHPAVGSCNRDDSGIPKEVRKKYSCQRWQPGTGKDGGLHPNVRRDFMEATDQIARRECEKSECNEGCGAGTCQLDEGGSDTEPQLQYGEPPCSTYYHSYKRIYRKVCGRDDRLCSVQE